MSKVTSVTQLASPAYQQRVANQKKVARLQKVQASVAAISKNIATAEKVANRTYNAFNHGEISAQRVSAALKPLANMHAQLGKNLKVAQRNLATAIQTGVPTARCLAQMESLATLRTKVASLIIQAKASLAPEDADLGEDLIPVDEEGYVVEGETPADAELPVPGVDDTASDDVQVDDVVNATIPQEQEDLSATASDDEDGEGDDLGDADGEFQVPDLNLPTGDVDEQVAQDLLGTDDVVVDEEDAPVEATASLRARTATRRVNRTASKAGSAEDVLKAISADLARV